MKYLISIIIGYLFGSVNPASMIAKHKNVNLREEGTHNLGASNTMLTIGKGYGALVMLFDIAKAFFASRLAKHLFPGAFLIELVAGCSAVVGHVFPIHMKFKGGKGLAAFGGMILAFDPMIFLILLIISLSAMLIFNYSCAMPMSAAPLFPIMAGLHTHSIIAFGIALIASAIIICKHYSNIGKAKRGEDIKIRSFIKNGFSK